MALYDRTGKKELTKANSIFVKDLDCHWMCIHEDDYDFFQEEMEKAYAKDDFYDFEGWFPNMCGGDPIQYRKQHLS